ncbi:hypothetical protein CBER1_09012 [Cercospora berteroae]|uniref:Uncharacterized protein n=1 Tax=Cercospora berteroae TaxID=357750 RepID=A0A2S6CC50_9PEZI|nr:hypothetical protein CBER1_09012 [Cercospora berteroae]
MQNTEARKRNDTRVGKDWAGSLDIGTRHGWKLPEDYLEEEALKDSQFAASKELDAAEGTGAVEWSFSETGI